MSSNSRTAEARSVFDARRAESRSLPARWIERAGWVVCGLAIAFAILAFTSRPIGHDLAYYLHSAQALVDGRSPYVGSRPACEAPVGCFPYPPPGLLLYVPLLGSPFGPTASLLAAAYTAIAVAVGAMLIAPLPRALRPWVGTAVALFFPLLLELNLLNMNLLTLALALGAWALRDRPVPGGIALAAAAGLKVVGAPLVLFYAAAGRWRQLAWTGATLALIALASAPWVGSLWDEAIGAILWRGTTADVIGIRPGPLRGTVAYVVLAAASAAVIVAAGIAARRSHRDAGDLHALALASIPLLAHLIQYPVLLMTLPLLAAEARALSSRPALLVLPGVAWLAMQMPLGMEAWRFGGLLLTVALGVWLFLRPALVPARAPLPARM
jgi:hypothetical protein